MGQIKYIPQGYVMYSYSAYIAPFVDNTLIVGNTVSNGTFAEQWTFYTLQYVYLGYLRDCYPNKYNLSLPIQTCVSSCQNYRGLDAQFLDQAGLSLGYLGYNSYPWSWPANELPLDCLNWRDGELALALGVSNDSIPAYGPYNVTAPDGSVITVPCSNFSSYTTFGPPGCVGQGFVRDKIWFCEQECPIGPIEYSVYSAIQVEQLVISILGICCCCFSLVILLSFYRLFFYTIPQVLIPVAIALGLIYYSLFIAPWIFGYSEVWCDGGLYLPITNSHSVPLGQFFISISAFASRSNSCEAQGLFLYWTVLALMQVIILYIFFSALGIWGLIFHEASHRMPKWLSWLLYPSTAFADAKSKWLKYGWRSIVLVLLLLGVSTLPLPVAISLASSNSFLFQEGSTFCFLDRSNTALYVSLWIVPILVLVTASVILNMIMLVGIVVLLFRLIFREALWSKTGFKIVFNFLRMSLTGLLGSVSLAIICSVVLYNAFSTTEIEDSYSDYLLCRVVQAEAVCEVDKTPEAMAVLLDLCLHSLPLLVQASFYLYILIDLTEVRLGKMFSFSGSGGETELEETVDATEYSSSSGDTADVIIDDDTSE